MKKEHLKALEESKETSKLEIACRILIGIAALSYCSMIIGFVWGFSPVFSRVMITIATSSLFLYSICFLLAIFDVSFDFRKKKREQKKRDNIKVDE